MDPFRLWSLSFLWGLAAPVIVLSAVAFFVGLWRSPSVVLRFRTTAAKPVDVVDAVLARLHESSPGWRAEVDRSTHVGASLVERPGIVAVVVLAWTVIGLPVAAYLIGRGLRRQKLSITVLQPNPTGPMQVVAAADGHRAVEIAAQLRGMLAR